MSITVTPSGASCGATITGPDLSKPLSEADIKAVHAAWMEHHVLAFPGQKLNHKQLLAFCEQFGEFGDDPFFNPLPGQQYIAAVRREAEDTNPIFAEHWHSDWSFLPEPPKGTVLYSIDIPPHGGNTEFSNQHQSFEAMPPEMKEKYANLKAMHSPALGYSKAGAYGDKEKMGSMDITPTDDAFTMNYVHPLAPEHPETGRKGFLSGASYIVGFEGVPSAEAMPMIMALNDWQSKEEFVYSHKWEKDMLVMWDNRSVVHRATGGYEGYRRELHRVTLY